MLAVVALALNAGVTLAQDKEKKDKHEGHEVPGVVKEAIARYYTGYEIEEAAKINSSGTITFEAEVEKGEQTFDLIFSDHGKLIKKISKEAEKN